MKKKTLILGIETSCDETAAAVIEENIGTIPNILSNVVSSQIDVLKEFGGVVPELAARSHIEKIDLIVSKAIKESGKDLSDIDGVEQYSTFTVSIRKFGDTDRTPTILDYVEDVIGKNFYLWGGMFFF